MKYNCSSIVMFTIPMGMLSNNNIIYLLLTIAGGGTYTYDGTTRSLSVTTNNDAVSYLLNGSPVTGSQSSTITNAGTLTITLAKDTTNAPTSNVTTSGSTTITINQATLTLTLSEAATQTYTGSTLSRTITPSNASVSYLIDGVAGTGTRTYTQTNYDEYTFTLASNDSNYVANISNGALTIEDTPHVEVVHGSQTPVYNVTNNTAVSPGYNNTETKMSVSILASFDSNDTGILYEAGGTIYGLVIYIYDKYLYLQAGEGTTGDTDMYELGYLLEENSQTTTYTDKHVDVSFEKNGNIILFIDHVAKAIGTFGNPNNFHGNNDLGIGESHNVVANNKGLWTGDGTGVFTGTISYAKVYHNLSFSGQVITMTFSNTTTTYTGSSQSLIITPSNTSVSYTVNGVAYTGESTYSQTNAGTYTIELASDNNSYTLDTTSTTFTINPAILTMLIGGAPQSNVYTGSVISRSITPSVTTSDDANSIEYLKYGQIKTGVTYTARLDVTNGVGYDTISSNNSNYVTNISRVYIEVTPATLTLNLSEVETQTYTGSIISRIITPSNGTVSYLIDGVAVTGTQSYQQTNYGEYTFTLATNDSNYVTNISSGALTIEDTPHVEVVHGSQTPVYTITNNTTISPGYANTETKMSISILASFDSDDTGILYEAGGTTYGLVIYIYNKYLYAQAGQGTTGDTDMYELGYLLEENSQTTTYTNKHIDISFEKYGNIFLFIDHEGKSSATYGTSSFHGSSPIGIGKSHHAVANNNAGWTGDGAGVFTGTISYAKIYHNLSFSGI